MEEDLELDDGVMQELLHDDDSPPSASGSNSSDDDEESNHDDTPHYIYNYIPSKHQLLQKKSLTTKQSKDVETIHEAASQLFHVINKYGGNISLSSKWEDILTATNSPWKNNVDAALDEIVAARTGMVQAWDEFHTDSDNVDNDNQQTMDGDNNDEWWEPILPSKTKLLLNRQDNDEKWNQTNNTDNKSDVDEQQQQFHHVYMEYATNAFATELEALRRGTLEQQTSTFKKKKKKKGNSNDKSSTLQQMELDLDPTQHSFVVASSKRSGNNVHDNDDEAKAAAAAEVDVQVLSDMLSSGSHTLSAVEKHMLLKARQRGSSSSAEAAVLVRAKSDGDGLSLHERRRQELGLLSGR